MVAENSVPSKLGILDWGIGGLGLYKLVKKEAPCQPVIYFSDSGFAPYGKVKTAELSARLTLVLQSLKNMGAERVVIACNAASTVLDHVEKKGRGLPHITGIIEHGIRAVLRQEKKKIGVIGGKRTIYSGHYGRALKKAGYHVRQRVAQPLSAFIEAGDFESGRLDFELRKILHPLRDMEAILLACTHYPAIADRIKAYLPSSMIIDPAEETLKWLQDRWGLEGQETWEDLFFTTGCSETMSLSAKKAFQVSPEDIKNFSIKS